MRRLLLILTATALLLVAQISAASACAVYWHEPDLPEALK